MAVYAIGDLQGCYTELQGLLAKLAFDPGRDRLWFVGDLVNRGPESLDCLRFVRSLGERAVTVLGNHDLSLASTLAGIRSPSKRDTIGEVLVAPDAAELLDWLRRQPLLHHDPGLGYLMVHAGLPPQWDLATAKACAAEVEAVLKSPRYPDFFRSMYGDTPDLWSPGLQGPDRWRFITNCLTRMRYCREDGRLELKTKNGPASRDPALHPWFLLPNRRNRDLRIIFGHWSTLGCIQKENVISLDTGCVWGGRLTAVRLDSDEPEFFSTPCTAKREPGLD